MNFVLKLYEEKKRKENVYYLGLFKFLPHALNLVQRIVSFLLKTHDLPLGLVHLVLQSVNFLRDLVLVTLDLINPEDRKKSQQFVH
jgi:hypothetical protein